MTQLSSTAAAAGVLSFLASGQTLQPQQAPAPGMISAPGEYAVAVFPRGRCEFEFARYRAPRASPHPAPVVTVVHPGHPFASLAGVVASQTAVSAYRNHASQPAWREARVTSVVLTTHQMWTEVNARRWLYFAYNTITHLQLAGQQLQLSFLDSEPLRLAGYWAPWCAAVIAHCRYGEQASTCPGIDSLQASVPQHRPARTGHAHTATPSPRRSASR